jgi:hypothetical protein
MIGFDPIGNGAIGELSGDQQDTLIFTPAAFAVSVTKADPLVSGGGSALAPVAKAVAVTTAAPAILAGVRIVVPVASVAVTSTAGSVQISATVTAPGTSVSAAVVAPRLDAGVLITAPAAQSVTATQVEPFVTAGKSQFAPAIGVTVTAPTALISISFNAFPATQDVVVTPVSPQILGGNFIEASNTVTMITPYGEIGSGSIGQGAIGEGDESTRIVKRGPLVILRVNPPEIFAGKSQFPPTRTITVTTARPEIGARRRAVRVFAIAS